MANTGSFLFAELTEKEILAVVMSVYPDAVVLSYELCHGGLFNTTYKISLFRDQEEKDYILRVGPIRPELLMGYEHDMMKTEKEVFSILKNHGIPVSEVVCLNTERTVINREFMLVEYIESVPLSSADLSSEDKCRLEEELGRQLRKMHGITMNSYGRATDVLYGKAHSDYFSSIFSEVNDLCCKLTERDFFTKEEATFVLRSVKKHESILATKEPPCLCHGDMWSGNVLVQKKDDKWTLAAIIDVDRAYFGDVDFDLGNPWILSDAFLSGYGVTRESLEVRERKIKREIAAMIYFLIEAYVWHAQYNNLQYASNGKKAALEKATWLNNI